MVNQWTGEWVEEKDYSIYPKEKWCDYDYMVDWIRREGYIPKIGMKDLIENIWGNYYYDEDVLENGYYAIKDNRKTGSLMIFIPDIAEYVKDNGGFKEFDW